MDKNFKLPLSIMLEPTDLCNCRCWMCPRDKNSNVHNIETSQPHFMEISLLEKILQDLKTSKHLVLDTLFSHWIGEPLLHPQFPLFISLIGKYYKSKNLKFRAVETHTNGIFWNKGKIDELFVAYNHQFPWVVSFSLDAIKVDTYKKIRRQNQLRKIYGNISNLIKEREKRGWMWPKIILQFIVQEDNFSEILPFYNYWKNFFKIRSLPYRLQFNFHHAVPQDTIFFRTLDYGDPKQQLENLSLHQKAMSLFKKVEKEPSSKKTSDNSASTFNSQALTLCTCLWQSLAIRWDGNVNLICDIENSLPLGNCKNEHLEQIFLYGKINYYRKLQSEGRGSEIEKCALCGAYLSPNSGTVSDQSVIAFLQKILT